MTDYEELRRLATAATPGPLHHNKDNEQIGDVSNEAGHPFLQVMQQQPRDHKQRDADAAYVAAALNAVPELLADLERKDALLRDCRTAIDGTAKSIVANRGLAPAMFYILLEAIEKELAP